MPISLNGVAIGVEAATARFGCTALADRRTDNVLVLLGGRGFVITRRYIEEHTMPQVIDEAVRAASDLADGKEQSGTGEHPVKFYSRRDLAGQSKRTGWG